MSLVQLAAAILETNFRPLLLSLVILAAPFFLSWLERKNPRKELLLDKINLRQTLLLAFALFAIIFLALLAQGLLLNMLGLLDNGKVVKFIAAQDLLTLLVAVTIGPIGEELLFRGYLLKRMGFVLQALLFGLLHYAYGSYSEILAAVVVGLILGYFVSKEKNIYAAILAHALYNTFAIIAVFNLPVA